MGPERVLPMKIQGLVVLGLAALVGCGEGGAARTEGVAAAGAPVEPSRRDSAGAEILEFPENAREMAPQFTVSAEPITVIGDDEDGSDAIGLAHSALLLPEGGVVLWDDTEGQLVLFDAAGDLVRRVGQRGQGPGDFSSVRQLTLQGDSVLVSDPGNSRLGIYSAGLELLITESLPLDCRRESIVGRLPGGEYVGFSTGILPWDLERADTIQRKPEALLLIDVGRCDTLLTLPGMEVRTVELLQLSRSLTQSVPVRYGRRPQVAVWGPEIATGTGDVYRVDLRNETGAIHRRLQVEWAASPIPPGARDTVLNQALAQFKTPGAERMIDREASRQFTINHTYVTDSLPAFHNLMVSSDGQLWVLGAWAPGLSEREATAFDRDGWMVAHLRMPSRFRPLGFGPARVLVQTTDEGTGIVLLQVLRFAPD